MERVEYDEFGLFHENAEEFGLPYDGPPTVRRESVELPDGRRLSALVWGTDDPEYVFLHGGAQNAHTWDTVAMALGRPLVAIDLPGHGPSEVGAGPLTATIWKSGSENRGWKYRFNIVRTSPKTGDVRQKFAPKNVTEVTVQVGVSNYTAQDSS
jgi:pimeloyl-ACP methyl ester carboxylesterase